MLQKAIKHYQKNEISKALKILNALNKRQQKQSYLSLQLEAVCLAKQDKYQQAMKSAELSLLKPHTTVEAQQGQALIAKLKQSINNSKVAKVKLPRTGPVSHSIVCDDSKAQLIVEQLITKMESMGAVFHQALRFTVEKGNLSIRSVIKTQQAECLLSVPLQCMPLLRDFSFSVNEDSQLFAKPHQNMSNPLSTKIMQLLVELFNVTGKLLTWQASFAFLTLEKHPEILNNLLDYRPFTGKIAQYKSHFDSGKWQALRLASFIGAREFTYSQRSLIAAGIVLEQPSEKGLLGLIDFLNHQVGDTGYQVNSHTSEMAIVASPDEVNGELFVQYGFYDPVQTFLIYGFVDANAPILYSGKINITLLSGGVLSILSMSGKLSRAEPLPSSLAHLSNFLPAGIKRQGSDLIVSDLIVPNVEAKTSLTEVLQFILQHTGLKADYKNKSSFNAEVNHIEKQLLLKNFEYWQAFQHQYLPSVLSDSNLSDTAKQDLVQLFQVCQQHILNYAEANNLEVNFPQR